MELVTLILFLPACFALNLSPGPNNLLAMSNAKRFGLRTACIAGLGRLVAFAIMITLAATGLASILYASENFFLAVKVLGACYLFWLAYQLWSSVPNQDLSSSVLEMSVIELAKQEFFLAAGNPKAILIFTAFLPQFINPDQPIGSQFVVLGALFLFLEWSAIAIYGCFGVYLRNWFSKPEMRQLFNRGCSCLLASAGVGLLVVRRV
ncbi:MAG: LysE family translocator [Pseudomonadales bacterium]|jgi:threonine/homoserine/homoserine lactone efflux protein|tara:strand:- start:395 stop:1015 length:621 start_codon:yes stop_codon:yes gene_type:complete